MWVLLLFLFALQCASQTQQQVAQYCRVCESENCDTSVFGSIVSLSQPCIDGFQVVLTVHVQSISGAVDVVIFDEMHADRPTLFRRENVTCFSEYHMQWRTSNATVMIQCTNDTLNGVGNCGFNYSVTLDCMFYGRDEAIVLSACGVLLFAFVSALSAYVLFYAWWNRVYVKSVIRTIVIGTGIVGILDVAVWAMIIVVSKADATTDETTIMYGLMKAIYVLERFIYVMLICTHMALLYNFIYVLHRRENPQFVRRCFWLVIISGIVLFFIFCGLLVTEFYLPPNDQFDAQLASFVSSFVLTQSMFFYQLVLVILMIVYGFRILRTKYSRRRSFVKMFLVLFSLLGTSLLRIGIGAWLGYKWTQVDRLDDIYFPGSYLRFQEVYRAVAYFVAYYMLPDLLPSFIILGVIISSLSEGKAKQASASSASGVSASSSTNVSLSPDLSSASSHNGNSFVISSRGEESEVPYVVEHDKYDV